MKRVHRFGIPLAPGLGHQVRLPRQQRGEADPCHGFLRRDLQQIQHRRQDVHRPHRLRHAPATRVAERRADNERHVHRAFVDKKAVGFLAVLSQALAVVGRHNHDGAVSQAAVLQERQHPADLLVGKCNGAAVGVALVLAPEGLGGLVWRVGVVEV